MKKFTLLLSLFITFLASSQVKWMTLEQAIEAQKTVPKKILVNFYTDSCDPCQTMEKNTYNQQIISAYLNDNYYPVKFNAQESGNITVFGRTFINSDLAEGKKSNAMHDFTKYMNVSAVPSAVFLDDIGNPITILQGALNPKELEPYIPFIATNEYKKINTREGWETYQKKFKSSIKD